MNTAVINVKVDQTLKLESQKIIEELGFSLSSYINAALKHLTRTRAVAFKLANELELTDYAKKILNEAAVDSKGKRITKSFDGFDDAVGYLKSISSNKRD